MRGCYSVCLSCSPTSATLIYTTKFVVHQQIYHEASSYIRTPPLNLVMVIRSAHLLISWLNIEFLPIVLTIESGVVCKVWTPGRISSENVFVLWSSSSQTLIKFRGLIKKINQITITYYLKGKKLHIMESWTRKYDFHNQLLIQE